MPLADKVEGVGPKRGNGQGAFLGKNHKLSEKPRVGVQILEPI